MSAAAPPPTPTVIAQRYELQRMLAQGGMAEVWLAVDLTLDRKVAVKWLKPTLATDEVVAERFRREAVAAASLNHPNIVAIHDVFEQDGRRHQLGELVLGQTAVLAGVADQVADATLVALAAACVVTHGDDGNSHVR